jgi:ketosteroid isomerase-like protein
MSLIATAQDRHEHLIRRLYQFAEGASKDTRRFVSLFSDSGYAYDASCARKYTGPEIAVMVDAYATAFPDIHRRLESFYFDDNVVVVELFVTGSHQGDLVTAGRTIPATGKQVDAPCCDVFHIKGGRITSFHCYLAASVMLAQIGPLCSGR